jgi:hypothetical protein
LSSFSIHGFVALVRIVRELCFLLLLKERELTTLLLAAAANDDPELDHFPR